MRSVSWGGAIPVIPLFLFTCACTPSQDEQSAREPLEVAYATQVRAPSPAYPVRSVEEAGMEVRGSVREPDVPLPRDASAIGTVWIERLEARNALVGYGLGEGSHADVITVIDTGLTEQAFNQWTAENGWTVPRHIRWSFVAELALPSVSERVRASIRVWPASTTRTGSQLQALHGGRVELRDGCFFVVQPGRPDALAWFHAEMGLDRDAEGYLVFIDRVDGSILARVGEELNWAGPASAQISDDARRALHDLCGPTPILVVGSPEASERFRLRLG